MSDGSTGSSGYKKPSTATSSKPQRTPSLDALLQGDDSAHSSASKNSGGGRTQALFTKPRDDAKTSGMLSPG